MASTPEIVQPAADVYATQVAVAASIAAAHRTPTTSTDQKTNEEAARAEARLVHELVRLVRG